MRRLIACLLVLAAVLAMPVWAEEATEPTEAPAVPVREPGQCGESLYWELEGETLTISGSGAMDDFPEGAPWADRESGIKKLVLEGVTYVGANAFTNFDSLETIDFGDDLYEIGTGAFAKCDGLLDITLPASFKVFGERAFESCVNLTQIHCEGRFPSFRQNCLWGVHCKIYFPAERPWGTQYILQLEEAFHGRIEFLASDGSDPVTETEPEETEEVTEAPTEEPTEPPTEPPTEALTEAPTEAPTAPPTQAPTEAPTQAPTQPETEPEPTQPEEEAGGLSTGLLIVGGVVLLVGSGSMGFALSDRKRKGKYRRK